MKIRTLTVIFAVFTLSAAHGQDYAFKVLANKGSNEVKSGATWEPLKTGAVLHSGDEVRLSDNAYVGLVHESGKPMEVKQAGSYQVSKLEAQIKGNGSSVINKYTDFILSSNSAEAKKNRLSATGAVHRATETAVIKLVLPDKNQYSDLYNDEATIRWDGSKAAGPYVVTFRNMFEDVLAKVETPETSVTVNLAEGKFAPEKNILVEVATKADAKQASTPHLIKKLEGPGKEKIKQSLGEIMGEVQEETALNSFILASFYENNNLLIDAISAYEQAVQLAPDVPSYQEAYDEFLVRNNLK